MAKPIKPIRTIAKKETDPHLANPHVRPSWDEYFIKISEVVGERATCDRGKTGSIAVRDKRILATGYVGAPMGVAHCDEVGHELHMVTHEDGTQSKHCIRTTHAEQNVVSNAARNGVALDGGTVYTHMTPCYACAKILINAGIKRVVANKDYHGGKRAKEVFKEAGVEFVLLNQVTESYANMK